MVVPAGLGSRGRRLWADSAPELLASAHRELLVEACRIVDRLERLDELLRGERDAWLQLAVDGAEVTVQVGGVLAEARQQTVALKGILAELRQAPEAIVPPAPAPAGEAPAAEGGPRVSDLTARIAARGTPAQG